MSNRFSLFQGFPFIFALFFVSSFLSPSPIFAQTLFWDSDEYINIYDSTVIKPDIYEVPNTPLTSEKSPNRSTTTPCTSASDCVALGSNYACLPNSSTPPQQVCTLPGSSTVHLNFSIDSTDYTPNLNKSQTLPKLQNLSQHYLENPSIQNNLLNYGSLELLLPATYKLELKLAALKQASETLDALQKKTPQRVIGPMPNRELTLPDGTKTTYVDFYNNLPSYLKTRSKGWQTRALEDPNPLVKAISQVNPSPFDVTEWAYAYNEVFLLGARVSQQVVPYQVHPRGDLFSVYQQAQISAPSSLLKPFRSNPTLLALTDTNTLLPSSLSIGYDSYIKELANNQNFPVISGDTLNPEADAIQPTNSVGLFNKVVQNITNLLQIKTVTKNFPSASQITTNELINLIASQNVSAAELSRQPVSKKAFPALTSVNNFSLPMGQGGGVSTLTNTFSRFLPCEAGVYSTAIPIKEYLAGKRLTCSKTDSTSSSSVCNTSVTNEQLVQATTSIGNKYGLPPKWLEGMFKYEGATVKMGQACQEETIYKVMGPLQISASAYRLTTCDNERFSDPTQEQIQCADTTKLSRCSLTGSLELAARTLLQKLNAYGYYLGPSDCHATKASPTIEQLYRATNAYSGCGLLDGLPYAQTICQYANSCPSSLPPIGDPITCQGN